MWLAELRQPYYCRALIPVNVCSTTFSWQERSILGKPIMFKDGLSMSFPCGSGLLNCKILHLWIVKLAPAMKASGKVVWFFPSEGAAQLPDWTTVQLHKMLNINLTKILQ